eukprot:scaffold399175_cov47-Prasinocladus_malaysianus.AAC.1
MAAWCLSCQQSTLGVTTSILKELTTALNNILHGKPLLSRLGQQYALTALNNLLDRAPEQTRAYAQVWVPVVLKIAFQPSEGGVSQAAVLRRDARK